MLVATGLNWREVKLIHSSPIDLCMDSLYRYSTNGGEIWAESEFGKGCCIVVQIPIFDYGT